MGSKRPPERDPDFSAMIAESEALGVEGRTWPDDSSGSTSFRQYFDEDAWIDGDGTAWLRPRFVDGKALRKLFDNPEVRVIHAWHADVRDVPQLERPALLAQIAAAP